MRSSSRPDCSRRRGEARQAGEVLDRWVWRAEGPLFVLGMLDRARIAESLGERQKAIDVVPVRGRCLAPSRPRATAVCGRGADSAYSDEQRMTLL